MPVLIEEQWCVAGTNQKGSIMETSGVSIGSATSGINLAKISHPNSIKTVNCTVSKPGSVCHSKLVPFAIPMT